MNGKVSAPEPGAEDVMLQRTRDRGIASALLRAVVILLACVVAQQIGVAADIGEAVTVPALVILWVSFVVTAVAWQWLLSERTGLATDEVLPVLGWSIVGGALALCSQFLLPRPYQTAAIIVLVSALLISAMLLATRAVMALFDKRAVGTHRRDADATIIVGTGNAAATLIRVIEENPNFPYRVVGCVDDNKLASRVLGVRVLGGIDDLPKLISKLGIGSVIIAIPFAPAALVKRTLNVCLQTAGHGGKPPAVKVLPGVLELLNDGLKISRIRSVRPEDLLPRDPVKVDLATVAPHVENRIILVTGAGGSIGSELCRQIVALDPQLLLLLGHGENSLFAIDEELRLKFGFTRTRIVLADVGDAARIRSVFSQYKPHVVFHAAAHKHVPIVEDNVCEALRNNVLGTHIVALAAAAAGAAKFVLLSTDKAVNPTSVMGATKRMAEIISQSFVNQTGTEFVTVRFGNVIESRGSVIPVFKRQIQHGGPLTITHRDMQRYFMTIPEAVSLVLEAMAIGRDGQVLVLDMGKPVNILRLAETLITLSGLTPYRDISIVETGIRPGEKLFEEILTTHEGLSTTSHERLFIAQQERVAYETLALGLRAVEKAVGSDDREVALDVLKNFVPSFQPGLHLREGAQNGSVEITPGVQSLNGAGSTRHRVVSNGHAAVDEEEIALSSHGTTVVEPASALQP